MTSDPWRYEPISGDAIPLDHLARLCLEPGDTLVLRIPEGVVVGQVQMEDMREVMREQFPDHKVLVLSPGMSLGVIRG